LAGGASRNWSNRVMYAPGNTALETVEWPDCPEWKECRPLNILKHLMFSRGWLLRLPFYGLQSSAVW
jgi:hypothetical protein